MEKGTRDYANSFTLEVGLAFRDGCHWADFNRQLAIEARVPLRIEWQSIKFTLEMG